MSELAKIFIVSVLNKQLKQFGESGAKVKILFVEFVNDLNSTVQKWSSKFSSKDIENLVFDKNSVIDILSRTSFNDFITISSDWLIIDLDRNYHNQIKQLLADTILTYSHGLIAAINQLGEKIQNPDSEQVADAVSSTITETNEPESQDQTPQIETVMDEKDETKAETLEEQESLESQNSTDRLTAEKEATDNDNKVPESTNEPESVKSEDLEEEENVKEAEKVAEIVENEVDMDGIAESTSSASDEKKAEEESDEHGSDKEVVEVKSAEESESDVKVNEETAEVEDSIAGEENDNDDNQSEQAQKLEESESEQEQEESKDTEASSNKRKSPIVSSQQHKRFQHIAVNLIDSIQAHRYSSPFLQQVSKRDAPDYYDVIYKPKDLKNILKAVKSKHEPPPYESIKQLEKDIILMFANCIMYNKSSDDLVKLTISMRNDVNNIFKLFEEAESDIK